MDWLAEISAELREAVAHKRRLRVIKHRNVENRRYTFQFQTERIQEAQRNVYSTLHDKSGPVQ